MSTKTEAPSRSRLWNRALRCSTLPWPNGWPASGGVPAKRTVQALIPLTSGVRRRIDPGREEGG